MKKMLVVSDLTNRIYWASVKQFGNDPRKLVSYGEKIDVTDMAINSVFAHMQNTFEKSGKDMIVMPGVGRLVFRPEDERE